VHKLSTTAIGLWGVCACVCVFVCACVSVCVCVKEGGGGGWHELYGGVVWPGRKCLLAFAASR